MESKMNEKGLILIVEDNAGVLDANVQVLSGDGHSVMTAGTLASARRRLKIASPDLVVLDVMLPDGDGIDFMPELRESCSAPVLFLTGRDKPEDRLAGLVAGGNDYIIKPYDINEFRLRVRNFLSFARAAQKPVGTLATGSLKLDMVAQQAFLDGEDMCLAPKEFALLHLFVTNEDKVMNVETLYEKVWGQSMVEDSQAVRKAISRLRSKLEESEFLIAMQRGAGYSFVKE